MTPKRNGLYLGYPRVSRKGEREDDKFKSPEFQAGVIRRYSEGEGLTVEMLAPEIDVSGSAASRPILDAAVERVKRGEAAGIVVAKLDRLSRMTPKDRVLLFEAVESAGGVILSASEQLDPSTPEGRFARDVFLGIARMQWEKYRQGFEDAKGGSIAAGIPVMTRAPLGYRQISDPTRCPGRCAKLCRHLEPDAATAPVVREAFEMAASGQGPAAIARLFESRGLASTQGSRSWTRQAAASVIRNRVYLGELAYGKDRRFFNENAHAAIVNLDTWQAAQRPKRGPAPPRSANPSFLCSGVLRCHSCGYVMVATTNGHGVRGYRCMRHHPGGDCPTGMSVVASKVEPLAEAAFWAITADLRAKATRKPDDDVAKLRKALEAAERRLTDALTTEMQDAAGDGWAEMVRGRRGERDGLLEGLSDAMASSTDDAVPDETTLREAWRNATVTERRELLAARLDCIALRRSGDVQATVWPKGTVTFELPFRGYKREPRLCPFPDEIPSDIRTLAL